MQPPKLPLRTTLSAVLALAVLAGGGCAGSDDAVPSGRIVMIGLPEVSLVPAAGGKVERQRLPIGGDPIFDAAFSPDSTKVAFGTDPGGIAVLTLETGRTELVPDQPPQDEFLSDGIAWAPDGKSLAFTNGDRVFVTSTDGTGPRRLARGSYPTWSRDGKLIVFVAGSIGGYDGDIAVIGLDGTGRRVLGRGLYPQVSPSGDEVAYSNAGGVFVQPLAGGEARLVVRDGFAPVWSPDGDFLAFARYTGCPSRHGPCIGRIFVVSVDGGEARPITPSQPDPPGPDGWIP